MGPWAQCQGTWNIEPGAYVYYLLYLYAPYTAGEEIANYYRHHVNLRSPQPTLV
jgi:hypothetical protein